MIFSIEELNELIYALGTAKTQGGLAKKEVVEQLEARLRDQLERQLTVYEKL
jgi:hypothetical protein